MNILTWIKSLFIYDKNKNTFVIRSIISNNLDDNSFQHMHEHLVEHHTKALRESWCHDITHCEVTRNEWMNGYDFTSVGIR